MTRVHVSLRVPGTAPMPELIKLVQDVEAAGFDGAGFLDSQLLCRDTFVTMGLAAAHTSALTLFLRGDQSAHAPRVDAGQRNPDRRGPGPGRIKVAIGTGYTAAHTIGRKPATLAEMRAFITTLRPLLAGETVTFNGTPGRLAYASGRRIPVLMAASGPKATELAGEIADGVLLSVGFHPRIVEAVLHHLAAGARRGGRRLEDLEVMWAVRVGIASSTAEARRQARPTVVHQAFLSARSHWLPYTGLTLPRFDIPPAVRAIYPDLAHARDWEQAIAATSFVPDEWSSSSARRSASWAQRSTARDGSSRWRPPA